MNSQATLLLVDDDSDLLDGLSLILKRAGYICHCAVSQAEALQVVHEVEVDLIISDINLAGQSGLVMCERLKQESIMKDMPVVFLSGASISDIIRRARAAGGTYYLRKPFDPEVLIELVEKALFMPHLANNQTSHA